MRPLVQPRQPLPLPGVLAIAAAMLAVLLPLANSYRFHRDELQA